MGIAIKIVAIGIYAELPIDELMPMIVANKWYFTSTKGCLALNVHTQDNGAFLLDNQMHINTLFHRHTYEHTYDRIKTINFRQPICCPNKNFSISLYINYYDVIFR